MRLSRLAGLLAATALAVAAGGVGMATAPPADAATGSVAIVISYSGGTDIARCIPAGGTGDTILNSVAKVAYRPRDGLIVQINSVPASAAADNTHYWAYYHDTGSGWTYSNVGASGYRPAAGTVEGWRYSNGANPGPPPPSVSFASICAPAVVVAPAPPAVPVVPQTTASAPRPTAATHAAGGDSSPSAPPLASTTAGSPVPSVVSDSASVSDSIVIAPSAGATSSSPDGSAPSSVSASPVAGARSSGGGGGSATGIVIALVLVAGLAAGAIVVAQRRRAS